MHRTIVRHLIDPYFQWRMRRRIHPVAERLDATQWETPERLRELQGAKLRALLRHADSRVPYYRTLFRQLGAEPEDFRTLDDLRHLPVLTKEVVRDRGRELIAEGPIRLSRRRTSGSTGIPLHTYIDADCWNWWLAAERRSRRWWGVQVGDRGVRLSSHRPSPGSWKRRLLLNEGAVSSLDLSEAGMADVLRNLVRFRPDYLVASSTTVLARVGQFLLDRGAVLALRAVFCTGEVLYPYQRRVIADAFRCAAVNEYGSSENWLVAAECPEGRLHIAAENVFVESRPVTNAEGGPSEILLTDLNNYGMPFIRYAIGDLGRPVEDRCACGRGLPLLTLAAGRTIDLALTPEGRHFDHMVLCDIFDRETPRVRQYRIIQEAPDRFLVQVAADRDEMTAQAIRQGFHRVLGPRAGVEVEFVAAIPADPSGKLRHFVSRLADPAVTAGAAGRS